MRIRTAFLFFIDQLRPIKNRYPESPINISNILSYLLE